MLHEHITINEKSTGHTGNCISCKLPVIWNGAKWVVTHEIGKAKVEKLQKIKKLDDLIGAQDGPLGD